MKTQRSNPRPAALDDAAGVVDLDVRDDLRNGREPFGRILRAREALAPGQVLRLRAIFEPRPLYRVMAEAGFAHWTERLADDDWRVWFYAPRAGMEEPPPEEGVSASPELEGVGGGAEPSAKRDLDGARVLDVRGLEPPEPMVLTLQALEALPRGQTLVQINRRIPRFLLPELRARGFEYAVEETGPETVRVHIRHAADLLAGER
ncbi:MAG TPA: DUF2249 domain-containing protein [Longimicrobiales bacterium]|nr:DUF2249 domain-containing protein [Longimicrobiales bacterium]